jgi:hypothetical protein
MKQLLNSLYVTTQGAYLARDGRCVSTISRHSCTEFSEVCRLSFSVY